MGAARGAAPSTSDQERAEVLRWAIVVNRGQPEAQTSELLAWAESQSGLAAPVVVEVDQAACDRSPRRDRAAAAMLRWIQRVEGHGPAGHAGEASRAASSAAVNVPHPDDAADAGLAALGTLRLDVLVDLTEDGCAQRLCSAARLGVLAVWYCGACRPGSDAAHGFWEVWRRDDTVQIEIRQVVDGSQSVLRQLRTTTQGGYALNRAVLLARAQRALRRLLREVAEHGRWMAATDLMPNAQLQRGAPCVTLQLAYLARRAWQAGQRMLNRYVMRRRPDWAVRVVEGDWRGACLGQARRLPTPPNRFLADPFVVSRDGQSVVFVEEFDRARARGHIAAYDVSSPGGGKLGDVIVEPFHMSFPFVFEYESKLYMCPEIAQSRELRIYECSDFPLGWKLHSTPLRDIEAADPMILPWDGRWWLLLSLDGDEVGDQCTELHAYYADDPLSGQWVAHRGNPLIVDSTRGRNGGLLRAGERLFRVGQRQAMGVYGRACGIYAIDTLTESDFQERHVARVDPAFLRGACGVHHMHSDGRFTVFDLVELRSAVPARVRRALRRVRAAP
ncbi:hypothetical protein GALL_281430 [mine drainage metagenome]|uniref:Glucosamine inositolphosphorylceramide transferase 1 N-terminal domain-containing protein n=1 Tax=mine drainage metagenome TaxID=410659 RepID=A0A1J5R1W4_9ZZZZ